MTKLREDTFRKKHSKDPQHGTSWKPASDDARWTIAGNGATLGISDNKNKEQCQAAANYANNAINWGKQLHQEICRVVMRWNANRIALCTRQ